MNRFFVLFAGLGSILVFAGAGNTPVGNYVTQDINTNGHAITNAATVVTAYSSSFVYSSGNRVRGSDGNTYQAIATTTGNDPTADAGTNWELVRVAVNTTLSVPSRFSTIGAAFTFVQSATIAGNVYVTIQVADGAYSLGATQYILNHPQGAQIKLLGDTATPANCVLDFTGLGFTPSGTVADTWGFICVNQGHSLGLLDGFTINGPGHTAGNFYGTIGVLASSHASIILGAHMAINGCYSGIAAFYHSYIAAPSVVCTGGGDGCIWAYAGSTIFAPGATASGASTDYSESGVLIEHGSSVFAPNLTTTGNAGAGVTLTYGSSANLNSMTDSSNAVGIETVGDGCNWDATGATFSSISGSRYETTASNLNLDPGTGSATFNTPAGLGYEYSLSLFGNDTTWQGLALKNTSTSGFASLTLQDTTGTPAAILGFGNSGVGTPLTSADYIDQFSHDFKIVNGSNQVNLDVAASTGNVTAHGTMAAGDGLVVQDANSDGGVTVGSQLTNSGEILDVYGDSDGTGNPSVVFYDDMGDPLFQFNDIGSMTFPVPNSALYLTDGTDNPYSLGAGTSGIQVTAATYNTGDQMFVVQDGVGNQPFSVDDMGDASFVLTTNGSTLSLYDEYGYQIDYFDSYGNFNVLGGLNTDGNQFTTDGSGNLTAVGFLDAGGLLESASGIDSQDSASIGLFVFGEGNTSDGSLLQVDSALDESPVFEIGGDDTISFDKAIDGTTPTNTVTPVGWFHYINNGTDAWLPSYQ